MGPLVVVTWVVLVSSLTVSATTVVSTSSTSRTPSTTSSPPARPTSSSSARRSPGSPFRRARVSSSASLRRETADGPTLSLASKHVLSGETSEIQRYCKICPKVIRPCWVRNASAAAAHAASLRARRPVQRSQGGSIALQKPRLFTRSKILYPYVL